MTLLLNPILAALEIARHAAPESTHADDEVTMEDQEGQWTFYFVPRGAQLGGGARVTINKSNLRVASVVQEQ